MTELPTTHPATPAEHLRRDMQERLARRERFVPIGDVLRLLDRAEHDNQAAEQTGAGA